MILAISAYSSHLRGLFKVIERLDLDSVWPSGGGSLDRESFRQRMQARGAKNDRAIDSVFNAFTGGTYLITRRGTRAISVEKNT